MKPFERAIIPQDEHERSLKSFDEHWQKDRCKSLMGGRELSQEEYERTRNTLIEDYRVVRVYLNDVYQVAVYDGSEIIHLSVKRRDRKLIHDWRDLQEIKNQLVGAENEAVELYPAESRRVDGANQYHIWCFKDPAYRIPFGFTERCVSDVPLGKSVNRPLEKTNAQV